MSALRKLMAVLAHPAAGGWGFLSFNSEVGQTAAAVLEPSGSAEEPAQVRFSMRDVQNCDVGTYIRAYAYMDARRASARNANLMDLFMDQFHVAPADLPAVAHAALGVRLTCPLNGDFEVHNIPGGGRFVRSDKWPERSYYQATADIPSDYEFPFISWLRGFKLQFQLDRATLSTKAQLEIQPASTRSVGPQAR